MGVRKVSNNKSDLKVTPCYYYSLEGEYWKYCTGQKNGVDAFDYNSAECEPIWMKYGIL